MSDLAVVNNVEAIMRRLLQPQLGSTRGDHEESRQWRPGLRGCIIW